MFNALVSKESIVTKLVRDNVAYALAVLGGLDVRVNGVTDLCQRLIAVLSETETTAQVITGILLALGYLTERVPNPDHLGEGAVQNILNALSVAVGIDNPDVQSTALFALGVTLPWCAPYFDDPESCMQLMQLVVPFINPDCAHEVRLQAWKTLKTMVDHYYNNLPNESVEAIYQVTERILPESSLDMMEEDSKIVRTAIEFWLAVVDHESQVVAKRAELEENHEEVPAYLINREFTEAIAALCPILLNLLTLQTMPEESALNDEVAQSSIPESAATLLQSIVMHIGASPVGMERAAEIANFVNTCFTESSWEHIEAGALALSSLISLATIVRSEDYRETIEKIVETIPFILSLTTLAESPVTQKTAVWLISRICEDMYEYLDDEIKAQFITQMQETMLHRHTLVYSVATIKNIADFLVAEAEDSGKIPDTNIFSPQYDILFERLMQASSLAGQLSLFVYDAIAHFTRAAARDSLPFLESQFAPFCETLSQAYLKHATPGIDDNEMQQIVITLSHGCAILMGMLQSLGYSDALRSRLGAFVEMLCSFTTLDDPSLSEDVCMLLVEVVYLSKNDFTPLVEGIVPILLPMLDKAQQNNQPALFNACLMLLGTLSNRSFRSVVKEQADANVIITELMNALGNENLILSCKPQIISVLADFVSALDLAFDIFVPHVMTSLVEASQFAVITDPGMDDEDVRVYHDLQFHILLTYSNLLRRREWDPANVAPFLEPMVEFLQRIAGDARKSPLVLEWAFKVLVDLIHVSPKFEAIGHNLGQALKTTDFEPLFTVSKHYAHKDEKLAKARTNAMNRLSKLRSQ